MEEASRGLPEWTSTELYALLPDELKMREVHHRVQQPGYRVRELVIARALLDAREYGAAEIAALYEKRWSVEIVHPDYRSSSTLYLGATAA
jgi:hypothetical protein